MDQSMMKCICFVLSVLIPTLASRNLQVSATAWLTDFHATVNSSTAITLFWTPSKHQAGLTNFTIVVYENLDRSTTNFTEVESLNVTGYKSSSTIVANLLSYTYYNFTIMASTSAGNSACVTLNRAVRTGTGVPAEPTEFYATVKNSTTVTLFWTPSKHQAGPTNYTIVVYGNLDQSTTIFTEVETFNVTGYPSTSKVVTNLLSYTYYNFTIMASTSAGNSACVTLNRAVRTGTGVPAEPTEFYATVKDSTTVTLFWTPSKHQAGPTDYTIVVYGNLDQSTTIFTEVETFNVTGYQSTSKVVTNLLSYTYYNFTIMATTSAGISTLVAFNRAVRTGTGVPAEPTEFHATVNDSTTITLFWTPSKHQYGATSYIIVVYGNVNQSIFIEIETLNVIGYQSSSTVVANLHSYTYYNFTIMTTTSAGTSAYVALNKAVRTGISGPAEPTDLHATVKSSTTITLFWTPSKHQYGQTSYIIVVYGNLDQRTNNFTEVETLNVTGYQSSSTVVANLLSYTYYNFTIMASTLAGNSTCVALNQAIRTGTGVPPAPRNLYATSTRPYIVNLSWTSSEHQAGPTTYLIDVNGELQQGSGNYINVQNLNVQGFSNISLIVQDLLSYTNYRFTIRAKTPAGESNTRDTVVRTQPEAADPPQNLKVEDVNASSVRLSWMPSKHQCGVTDYIVDVEEQPHLQAEFYVLNRTITVHGFHNNSIDIADLTSYWKYTFSVRARTSVPPDSVPVTAQKQTLQYSPGPVTSLTFSPVRGDYSSLILHFTCLAPDERHGDITHYIINYTIGTELSGSNCGMSAMIQNTSGITVDEDGSCNFSTRVAVTPERNYTFTIQAFNTLPGKVASFVTFTRYGFPGSVRELKTLSKTNSSVTVQWATPEHVNGMIHSYQLSVELEGRCIFRYFTDCGAVNVNQDNRKSEKECRNTGISLTTNKITHKRDLHYITINNLLSYTNYTITVVAINTNGSGPESNITFMTEIGVPAEPTDVHATVTILTKLTLFWTPNNHKAGPTSYIIVVYGNLDQINNFTEVETLNITGYQSSSTVVANLLSYTYYKFTVMASTLAGNSACVSLNQAIRTGTGVPPAPRNLHTTSISPYIVNLFWTPSEHQAGPTAYLVEVYGELNQGSGTYTHVQSLIIQGFSNTSLIVQDLLSYTNYRFTIKAKTSAGESITTDRVVRTQLEAADPPQNMKVENVTGSSVRLSWLPSNHQCGVTDYIVDVEEQPHLQAEFYVLNRTITVHGFLNNAINIADLTSYWKYSFSVRARTSVPPDSSSVTVKKQTLQCPPGRVDNIQVSSLPDNYTAVKLTWDCPEERERHGPISHYTVQYSDKVNTFGNFPDGDPCRESHTAIFSVHPEQSYQFTVSANAEYGGIKSVSHTFYAEPGKPPQEISTEVFTSTITSESSESTTDSTFLVSVNTDILRDSTNGHVVMTALLVMRETAVVDVPKNLTMTSLKKWRGWKEWKKDHKGTYRPTPDNWLIPQIRRKRRSSDDDDQSTTQFIVGANSDCENIQDVHCNGPVEADTTYRVISVACTNAGCTSSQPFGPFKTVPTSVKAIPAVAALVGGLLAALVVVGIVVGVLLYRRRRKRKNVNGAFESPVEEDVEEIENCVDNIRPKKITEISRIIDGYHKNADLQFSQEWREISRSSPIHPCHVASLEINRPKNCYVNILAYDHTRVRLLPKKERTESDYINANYIPGYSGPKDYIASQGPMAATVDDFWQMVWEQNVSVIVQLTEVYEKGRRMFTQYWPDSLNERVLYGDIAVEVLDASMINKCTRRTFKVSLGSVTRTVEHFFLQDWQYNNLKPLEIIDFAKNVQTELDTNNEGPMIVHCSAGVGRTGTFICVDYFMQVIDKADLDDSIDIFSFVLKMRDCRPLMVQSESQYVFVHDVVKEMIQAKLKTRAGKGRDAVYQNQAFVEFEEEELSNETHT